MIPQIDLSQNATAKAVARHLHRAVEGLRKWYSLEASAVPELLGVNPSQGLMESEVVIRRRHYGANSSESRGSRQVTGLFVLLFLIIVIGFLMTAAILNSAITDSVEAFSILAITLLGAIVGFAYLLKSARTLDRMADATRTHACVKRGGKDIEIKTEELVPGDIIILKAGEYVPANGRLLECAQLRVDESDLNGERRGRCETSVGRSIKRRCWPEAVNVFLGTKILSGSGLAAVVATGFQTELGRRAIGDA